MSAILSSNFRCEPPLPQCAQRGHVMVSPFGIRLMEIDFVRLRPFCICAQDGSRLVTASTDGTVRTVLLMDSQGSDLGVMRADAPVLSVMRARVRLPPLVAVSAVKRDSNVLNTVWHIVIDRVQPRNRTSKHAFVGAIKEAWAKVPAETLNALGW